MLFILNHQGYTPLDTAILDNNFEKSDVLLRKAKKFTTITSLRFISKPHRLELKYEKSFTLAVKRNQQSLL
jgi:hypothetical protein